MGKKPVKKTPVLILVEIVFIILMNSWKKLEIHQFSTLWLINDTTKKLKKFHFMRITMADPPPSSFEGFLKNRDRPTPPNIGAPWPFFFLVCRMIFDKNWKIYQHVGTKVALIETKNKYGGVVVPLEKMICFSFSQ